MKTILASARRRRFGRHGAAAQTSVSIGINQPGVYGRVTIGDVPRARALARRAGARRAAARRRPAAAGLPLRAAGAPAELAPLLRPAIAPAASRSTSSATNGCASAGRTSIRGPGPPSRAGTSTTSTASTTSTTSTTTARATAKTRTQAQAELPLTRHAAAPAARRGRTEDSCLGDSRGRVSPRAASGTPALRARAARGSGSSASCSRSRAAPVRTRRAPSARRPRRRRRGAGWRR